MQELGFYFFQCVNDRILAKAGVIEMYIVEDTEENKLELIIRDNGQKFDVRLMKSDNSYAKKSFPSLYFLQENSKENKGNFQMLSHNQSGNFIEVTYPLKKSKRPHFGKVAGFLSQLFINHPKIHFIYSQISGKGELLFDSKQFKKALDKNDFADPKFLANLEELLGAESASIQDFA